MKKEKIKQEKIHKNHDKGQIFVKVMAGILALMMVATAAASLIFSLLG